MGIPMRTDHLLNCHSAPPLCPTLPYNNYINTTETMNYSNFWDNVLKQEDWNDELMRWENTHPEYNSFKEDFDSQRQQHQKDTP